MAVVLEVWCQARQHGPRHRAAGCVCPEQWGVPYRPTAWRPLRQLPRGVRSRIGRATRATEPEPDWAAVERAVGGDLRVKLTSVDLDAAIDRLDGYRLSAQQVAVRLGVSTRTVTRRRAARRAEDGA